MCWLMQWERGVHDRIHMLWLRACRLTRGYGYHVNYVPGCVWSKPPIPHIPDFYSTWEGPLGRVVGHRWVPSALI